MNQARRNILRGTVSATVLSVAAAAGWEDGDYTVLVCVRDQAGNTSLPGSDSATVGDTTATAAPTVEITEDTNDNGVISNSELSGTVGVKVTLPTGAVAGDTLEFTEEGLKINGELQRREAVDPERGRRPRGAWGVARPGRRPVASPDHGCRPDS